MKLFSRNLRVINREVQAQQPAPAAAPAAAAPSKREKALEYAARVPKPRVREPIGVSDQPLLVEPPLDALAALELRHAEAQRQAAAIRADLGLG